MGDSKVRPPRLGRVMVTDWWDVFTFDDDTTITCPDCDLTSPGLEHMYAAAWWVEKHLTECQGSGAAIETVTS